MSGVDADRFNAFERSGWADNSADGYERVFGPITRRVIDDLLDAARVSAGTRVVDVATGPGYVAARASARGAAPIGVDLSPQMLERARRAHPDLRFERGDAEALPLADASFDAAVVNFGLLHVGRPERVAAECRRVLAPGGRTAMTVWNAPARARLFGVVLEAVRDAGAVPPPELPPGPDFFRFAEEAAFERLLTSAGFSTVTLRAIDFVHRIPDADHLWAGMLHGSVRTRALLAGQTEEMRARIRRGFESGLEAYRVEGGCEVPVSVVLASGLAA